jgi:hypothetical protein
VLTTYLEWKDPKLEYKSLITAGNINAKYGASGTIGYIDFTSEISSMWVP